MALIASRAMVTGVLALAASARLARATAAAWCPRRASPAKISARVLVRWTW